MNWEQKIDALSVRQLLVIAVVLAAAILIYLHWDDIQSKMKK